MICRFYAGLRYQPDPVGDLTRREGSLVGEFVRAAKEAGFKVYFQIMAASPPAYRVQFCSLVEDDHAAPARRQPSQGPYRQ